MMSRPFLTRSQKLKKQNRREQAMSPLSAYFFCTVTVLTRSQRLGGRIHQPPDWPRNIHEEVWCNQECFPRFNMPSIPIQRTKASNQPVLVVSFGYIPKPWPPCS